MKQDKYHSLVRYALETDGWTITHDPYPLAFGLRNTHIDLGAEKLLAAEKGTERIAIEVKSFTSPSLLNDLEKAIGQIRLYRFALKKRDPYRVLYLAIPNRTFNAIQSDPEIKEFIQSENVNLIIYNLTNGVIEKWLLMD